MKDNIVIAVVLICVIVFTLALYRVLLAGCTFLVIKDVAARRPHEPDIELAPASTTVVVA